MHTEAASGLKSRHPPIPSFDLPGAESTARCLFDACDLPESYFGPGRGDAARNRKLVLMALARFADPDGSNTYPSQQTIAKICLLTDRTVRSALEWLESAGLIERQGFRWDSQTVIYKVNIPSHAIEEVKIERRGRKQKGRLYTNPGKMCTPPETSAYDPGKLGGEPRKVSNPKPLYLSDYRPDRQNNRQLPPSDPEIQSSRASDIRNNVDRLAVEAVRISEGRLAFTVQEKKSIQLHLRNCPYVDTLAALRQWVANHKDDEYKMRHAGRLFTDSIKDLTEAEKQVRIEKAEEAESVEAAKERMQREAEADRVRRAEAEAKEAELIEDVLGD